MQLTKDGLTNASPWCRIEVGGDPAKHCLASKRKKVPIEIDLVSTVSAIPLSIKPFIVSPHSPRAIFFRSGGYERIKSRARAAEEGQTVRDIQVGCLCISSKVTPATISLALARGKIIVGDFKFLNRTLEGDPSRPTSQIHHGSHRPPSQTEPWRITPTREGHAFGPRKRSPSVPESSGIPAALPPFQCLATFVFR
jgi:hypothetical protein